MIWLAVNVNDARVGVKGHIQESESDTISFSDCGIWTHNHLDNYIAMAVVIPVGHRILRTVNVSDALSVSDENGAKGHVQRSDNDMNTLKAVGFEPMDTDPQSFSMAQSCGGVALFKG